MNIAPEGWPTFTPRIVTDGAEQLVTFIKQVFGATREYQSSRPAELRIGDSVIMVSDAGERSPMAAFLYVYVRAPMRRIASPSTPARVRSRRRSTRPPAIGVAWSKTPGETPGRWPHGVDALALPLFANSLSTMTWASKFGIGGAPGGSECTRSGASRVTISTMIGARSARKGSEG
jgi:hypothetical protein